MIRNRRVSVIASLLLMVVGVTAVFAIRGNVGASLAVVLEADANSPAPRHAAPPFSEIHSASYVYYTLKQSTGFVLARAPKGTDGQPLSTPQLVAHFSNDFGLRETDSVSSMQLSPDGRYLAINGTSDHGEEVWIYDTQRMTLNLLPAAVMGNFLHWLPGKASHTFLYRPMFPLGPSAPMDGGSWNPGLWEVDASTGAHKNIDIGVPSAFLVDAAPSPNDPRIVYSTSAGQGMGSDVWMMKPDGSARTHLFHTASGAQSIAGLFTWSPDGKNIAYEMLSDSPTPFLPAGLWVMNNSGSQQRHLADTDGGHGFAPVWSPDSRSIAYVVRTNTNNRLADQTMQALQSAIAVVDVICRGVPCGHPRSTLVASSAQTGMQINVNPQWIADSSTLIFTASNPINQVLGGTPRYWLAHINHIAGTRSTAPTVGARFIAPPSLEPLSPAVPHVIAMGD